MLKKLVTKTLHRHRQAANSLSIGDIQGKQPLTLNIDANLQVLQKAFQSCSDIVFREFQLTLPAPIRAFIVYADSLCDPVLINESILKSIMLETSAQLPGKETLNVQPPQFILERLLTNLKAQMVSDILELTDFVLDGNLILVIDGYSTAIVAAVQGYEQRTVNEPSSEQNIRGPKDGFVESLTTNVSLLRRRIRSSRLKVETMSLGRISRTKVAVCYIEGIANEKIVQEVKGRLQKINTDSILDGGYIEEFIADEPFTIFPLVQNTERPDRTAASMFEGKIAVITDNTPSILIVPCTFISLLQAAEDYYNASFFATFIRLGRFIAINIALLAPAITIAVFSSNSELIPITFLGTVAGAREDLPFPISVEIILMELAFELLREAGVRLPRTVGQAISTVGGLVIGQAAVTAGIVSPISVIIVSVTAIASFTFPDYAVGTSLRILRFGLILLASFLGITGIMLGLMAILIHLCDLRSFGVPYLSPISPLSPSDLKDTFVRAPWWAMSTRPRLIGSKEHVRQGSEQGPAKPGEGGNEQ
ncbi:spore germination protein [Desulfosporosinus sp. SB140]|uniref:spore germination protein n=1 Tax=Desulfosporosinus paludis TaxID=3115649 RepID=UPI00388D7FF6